MTPSLPTAAVGEVDLDRELVVDVREDDEWAAGHIPGALHVPLGEVVARLSELPTDRPLAVVCRVGGRSAHATAFLLSQGLTARNVDGGMLAWAAAGRPMTAADGRPRVL